MRSPKLNLFVKNALIWVIISAAVLLTFHLWIGPDRGGLTSDNREQISQAQAQREEAGPLISNYLKQPQPSKDDLGQLLANEAVKKWGCWIIYHRMGMPFATLNLQPSDVNLPEYRRMFELLEVLAATEGVFTMPYGSPGYVISGGLDDLMKIYDLHNDLESDRDVYDRLKAIPPEDDYLGVARGDGAYRLVKLYGRAGRMEEAEKARDEMLEMMKPELQYYYLARTHMHLAAAWAGINRLDKALEYYDQLKTMRNDRDISLYRLETIETLEPAYRRAGDHQKADALLAEAKIMMKNPEVARFVKMTRERRPFI